MEARIYNYLLLALLAASPVGEELVSIPLGFYQGLPILPEALVSMLFNFLPAAVILAAARAGENNPSALRFVNFFRRERAMKLVEKYGPWGVALLSPLAGVYSMTVCAWVLGMGKTRILAYTLAGLAAYAAVVCVLLLGGAKLFARFS
ncbi:MAG: small multi-drug export protein [Nitrospinae bacterium]|nr:small multi-drug export protein [Nitrospinota bacterium]